MNKLNLQKLKDKAGEMALRNMWGESAYKINMAILRMDQNNTPACTRLAKYYKLNDNISEAKKMYIKALEIDPNNLGANNNLYEIEKDEKERDTVEQIKTVGELFKVGNSSMVKGKYDLAEKLFMKAYSMEPTLKYALSLAGLYKKMGKQDSVEKVYKQLIDATDVEADVEAINNEFKALRMNVQTQTK